MNKEERIKLELITERIGDILSTYCNKLLQEKSDPLLRVVGELNCAYNHCIASLAGDGDIYCILKHLATSIILAGEVDGNANELYQIVDTLTDGVVAPCKACHDEESDNKEKEE